MSNNTGMTFVCIPGLRGTYGARIYIHKELSTGPTGRKIAEYSLWKGYDKVFGDFLGYEFGPEQFVWAKMFLESEKAYTEKKISIEEYRKLSKRERF